MSSFDLVIRDGLWFDGLGSKPAIRSIGIRGGKVAEITDGPLDGDRVIDAAGTWGMPGFLDTHTHYDGLDNDCDLASVGGTVNISGNN